MKILFIDQNKELVAKVKKLVKNLPFKNVSVKCGDIFKQNGLIVSASNPSFAMGGGLDALIARHYPQECAQIDRSKGNQRIGDIIFTVTVNDEIKATRELVGNALKFAISNTEKDETVLISGLGTGIGGMDMDEFVYLFGVAVTEANGWRWGIKFTKSNGNSFNTNQKTNKPIKYVAGKTTKVLRAPKDGEECGHGIHLGKSLIGAGNYAVPEKVFFCIFKEFSICGEGTDKVRVNSTEVVCELPLWMGYGVNGKKFLDNKNKPFKAEDYNPYQATKIPDKSLIRKFLAQVWDQVGDQVGDQVRAQVRDQVWDQVWDQVRAQVWDQVWDQVGAQVRAQVCDQVWDQVRDQVWDQVVATSYWAVNLHFYLGISHWFGEFLKLGVMIVFVKGKVKIFGKQGKYLGEYDESEFK